MNRIEKENGTMFQTIGPKKHHTVSLLIYSILPICMLTNSRSILNHHFTDIYGKQTPIPHTIIYYHINEWMNESFFQNFLFFLQLFARIVNSNFEMFHNKSNFNWTKQILLFNCVNFEQNDFIGCYIQSINAFILHAIKRRTFSMNNSNNNKNWI